MSTIFGLLVSVGLIIWGLLHEGAHLDSLWGPTALAIVLGGAFGSCIMAFGLGTALKFPVYVFLNLTGVGLKPADIIQSAMRMADKARQFGLPALTSEIPVAFDEFHRRGIKLLIGGTDSRIIRAIMEDEIDAMKKRHKVGISYLEQLAGLAPTMGMVGTIVGMIHTLGNLEDTAKLGPSIALAMIATFYGVAIANLVFIPMQVKLQYKSESEARYRQMIIEGLLSVQAGENSMLVGQRLKAFLSDRERSAVEGGKGLSKKKTEKHIELATYMGALDQEKAMAFMKEFDKLFDESKIGQDDVKNMLASLINEAEDKIMMRDFSNEFMKWKKLKKVPKGSKMPKKAGGKKKAAAGAKKKSAEEDDE